MRKLWLFPVLLLLGAFVSAQNNNGDDFNYDPESYVRKPLFNLPEGFGGDDDYLDLSLGLNIGTLERLFYFGGDARVDYNVGPFTLTADLGVSNDQKYAPARVMNSTGNIGGIYFMLNEGGVSYDWKGFGLQGGRFKLYDIVDSPYSLYINSLGHASNTLKISYESPRFIYSSRWIELNSRSAISTPAWDEYHRRYQTFGNHYVVHDGSGGTGSHLNDVTGLDPPYNTMDAYSAIDPRDSGFPDRGVNYKIYAFKWRDMRLGILDAAVYTGRSFDYEYFLNPLPQYFIQYVKGTPGRPWATDSNENELLGFFWDIKKERSWDAYAQFLMDDFGLGFVSKNFSDNPWKAAWAVGGRIHTRYGRFGFHHGGALKYTFEPITSPNGTHYGDISQTAYGYTYYPETRYNNDEDGGETVSILIQDNMVGYKHGENNIAFQLDYQNTFAGFLVNAELEFVLAGNNSPANPWQDYTHRDEMGDGSRLLNDKTLEKTLEFRLNVSHRRGPWTFFAATALGGRFNRLRLEQAWKPSGIDDEDWSIADERILIWKGTQEHELILRFSLGFKYTIPIL
jgi:hypothetical protein